MQDILSPDAHFRVEVTEDPETLATTDLNNYRLLVMNYCNWERPGLSETSKANFQEYISTGGGLAIIHFGNGAFHFSLPGAEASDWPDYRRICRRVWDHTKGNRGHDPLGAFRVEITKAKQMDFGPMATDGTVAAT